MAILKRQESITRLESYKEPIREYMSPSTRPPETVEPVAVLDTGPEITPQDPTKHFSSILIKNRGAPYRANKIVSWSHYNDPIVSNVNYRGRSRIWGDAELDAQERVIEDVVRLCRKPFTRRSDKPSKTGTSADIDDEFIALVIAIMRVECGFNIDAAAGTTSASSLGQFVKKTGKVYGIQPDYNMWDFTVNARALVNHTLDNRDLANNKGQGFEYIYAYHHDGPSLAYGGLGISRKKIMPWIPKIKSLVESFPA